MKTLMALLLLASHITANSSAGGGLKEPTKHWVSSTMTYGDQKKNMSMRGKRIKPQKRK